jgi:hypothetical protein
MRAVSIRIPRDPDDRYPRPPLHLRKPSQDFFSGRPPPGERSEAGAAREEAAPVHLLVVPLAEIFA